MENKGGKPFFFQPLLIFCFSPGKGATFFFSPPNIKDPGGRFFRGRGGGTRLLIKGIKLTKTGGQKKIFFFPIFFFLGQLKKKKPPFPKGNPLAQPFEEKKKKLFQKTLGKLFKFFYKLGQLNFPEKLNPLRNFSLRGTEKNYFGFFFFPPSFIAIRFTLNLRTPF